MAEILVTRPEYLTRLTKLQEEGKALNDESLDNIVSMLNFMAGGHQSVHTDDDFNLDSTLKEADKLLEDNGVLIDAQKSLRNEIDEIKHKSVLEKCGIGDYIISYVPYFKNKDVTIDFTISRILNINLAKQITYLNYHVRQQDVASELLASAMRGTNSYSDEEMEGMILNSPLFGEIGISERLAEDSIHLESYILTKEEAIAVLKQFMICPTFENKREFAKKIDEIILPGVKPEKREVGPEVC
jgi:hypothetical protein